MSYAVTLSISYYDRDNKEPTVSEVKRLIADDILDFLIDAEVEIAKID